MLTLLQDPAQSVSSLDTVSSVNKLDKIQAIADPSNRNMLKTQSAIFLVPAPYFPC